MRYLMALALLCCACAGATWTKQGSTRDEFSAVKWQCLRDAKALNDNHSWSSGWTERQIFEQCMTDHGWTKG